MKNRERCALGLSKPGSIETISDSLVQNELQNRMANLKADEVSVPLQMMNSMLASMLGGLDFSQMNTQENIIRGKKEIPSFISSRSLTPDESFLSGLTEKSVTLPSFAYGGTVPIEAEGGEMIQTPNGTLSQLKGPSHENGGIDLNIPQGTDIYSKRIRIGGKTLAQRKKSRELERIRLEKRLSESEDPLLRKTLGRILEKHALEEESEKIIQNTLNKGTQKAAYGYTGEDDPLSFNYKRKSILNNPLKDEFEDEFIDTRLKGLDTLPVLTQKEINLPLLNVPSKGMSSILPNLEEKKVNLPSIGDSQDKLKNFLETNIAGIPTGGDLLGVGGNIYQGINALLSAERNAATDLPNENPYLNYGKEAQKELENTENYLGVLRENQKRDLRTSRNASITRGRRSARDINTMRSLDFATDEIFNKAFSDIDNTFTGQLMSLANQKANLSKEIDQIVMGGEAQKDLANRQDKGARDSAIAKGKGDLARMISLTGKDLNDIKERLVKSKLLNQSFDYLKTNIMTGDITQDEKKSGNINPYYTGSNTEDFMTQLTNAIYGHEKRRGGKR